MEPAPLQRVLACALAAWALAVPARAQVYLSALTDVAAVRTTVTNHGVLGNNFTTRNSSLEYPVGTGYEHMTHGGLWLGAHAVDGTGPFTGVVTGGLDQFLGVPSSSLTEFSPLGNSILRRSRLALSPVYDPVASGDDETVVFFDDHVAKVSAGNSEPNRPVGLLVRQVTHAWASAGYADFVIVRYIVTSTSAQPVEDLWVGLYTELSSGPRNNYSTWPPSGSWFWKKWVEWDPAWRMVREHYCAAQPVPANCNLALVPPWIGVQLLTAPGPGRQLTLSAWEYAPGDASRDEDLERYALMSAGTIANLSDPALQPGAGDPVELLATGPFALPSFGDSIEVAFALVGGASVPELQQHARSAQALHDAGYRIAVVDVPHAAPGALAIAPESTPGHGAQGSFVLTLPVEGAVRLEWFDLAGRRVARDDLGSLPPGSHRVALARPAHARAGIYLVRVTQAGAAAQARVVWLE